MAKPKAGAQLFTVREFTKTIEDVAETLKKVAAIGYTEVQVSGFGPMDMKEVGKLAKDNGLKVAATHTGWPRFLKELDAVIEDHKALGCDHPAVGGVPGEYRTAEGIKKFVDELLANLFANIRCCNTIDKIHSVINMTQCAFRDFLLCDANFIERISKRFADIMQNCRRINNILGDEIVSSNHNFNNCVA